MGKAFGINLYTTGGERFIIDAEDKEEQKEQVPVRDIDVLPPEDEPLILHSPVINYHPFRRPMHKARFPFGNRLPNNWNNKI